MSGKQLILSAMVTLGILASSLGHAMTNESATDKVLSLLKKTPTAAITLFKILSAVYETKTTLDSFTSVAANASGDINNELLDLKSHIIRTVDETNTQIKLSMTLDTIPKLFDIVQELNDMAKQSAKLMRLLGKDLINHIHNETGQKAITTASRIDLTIADLEVAMQQVVNELVHPLKRDIANMGSVLQQKKIDSIDTGSQQLLQILKNQQQIDVTQTVPAVQSTPQTTAPQPEPALLPTPSSPEPQPIEPPTAASTGGGHAGH